MTGTPNLLRKVKLDGTWRMLPVAKAGDRHDLTRVIYKGAPLLAKAGTFYLEYRDPEKIRRAIGNDPKLVPSAIANQTAVLRLRAAGGQASDAPEISSNRPKTGRTLREVVNKFKSSPPVRLRTRSLTKYREALESFMSWTTKTHLSEIDRQDILDFMGHMIHNQELNPSTAVDKGVIVRATFEKAGATIKMERGDWPMRDRKQRDAYDDAVLKKMFDAADAYERTIMRIFLHSGVRDAEASYLSWLDFKPERSAITVTAKPHLGFRPKNYHERTIYIPPVLVEDLLAHRERQMACIPESLREAGGEFFILATSRKYANRGNGGGKRDVNLLEKMKRLALRSGVNCGQCHTTIKGKAVTCATQPVCERFNLHMFRHTYATNRLNDGMTLPTLQEQLGHKDLESTMVYVRALDPASLLVLIGKSKHAMQF